MINIADYKAKCYVFKDGTVLHKTHNLSMRDFLGLQSISDIEDPMDAIEIIDDLMGKILLDDDMPLIDELPVQAKIALLRDYLEFHTNQMHKSFPSPAHK